MNIQLVQTNEEIQACFPVMQQLRPHIEAGDFLSRVREQQRSGYRLASVNTLDGVVAVAGFRLGQNLAWGHFLYVDDLVTLSSHRSRGHGSGLLAWLKSYAAEQGCAQIHLDSGLQRTEAHRFYEREGMPKSGFHFAADIAQ